MKFLVFVIGILLISSIVSAESISLKTTNDIDTKNNGLKSGSILEFKSQELFQNRNQIEQQIDEGGAVKFKHSFGELTYSGGDWEDITFMSDSVEALNQKDKDRIQTMEQITLEITDGEDSLRLYAKEDAKLFGIFKVKKQNVYEFDDGKLSRTRDYFGWLYKED